jgi:ribosomal protein S10
MYFSLKIFSKDSYSMAKFLDFLLNITNPFVTFCNFPQRKKKNFVTVLKSPHINKTAQEQFEYKIFYKTIRLWSPQYKFLVIILKKAIKTSFPGIQVQFNSLMSYNIEKKVLLRSLNPKTINFFFFQKLSFKNKLLQKKQIIKQINLFDSFGGLILTFHLVNK